MNNDPRRDVPPATEDRQFSSFLFWFPSPPTIDPFFDLLPMARRKIQTSKPIQTTQRITRTTIVHEANIPMLVENGLNIYCFLSHFLKMPNMLRPTIPQTVMEILDSSPFSSHFFHLHRSYKMEKSLIEELLNAYDTERRLFVIGGEDYILISEDVCLQLGLPHSCTKIEFETRISDCEFMKKFVRSNRFTGDLIFKVVGTVISNGDVNDIARLSFYFYFVLSCFLMQIVLPHVPIYYLKWSDEVYNYLKPFRPSAVVNFRLPTRMLFSYVGRPT